MSSEFGSLLKISVFGQSHGRAIGVVVDGLPAGEAIDLEELNAFLARRKPGKSHLSTARREADARCSSPAWKIGCHLWSPSVRGHRKWRPALIGL